MTFDLTRQDLEGVQPTGAIPDWFVVELARTLGLSLDEAYDAALELQQRCYACNNPEAEWIEDVREGRL